MSDQPNNRRKHVPQRSCVACRQKFDKRDLTRLVYTVEGLQIDPKGKQNGRGAYLCSSAGCWKRAHQSNILERALRVSLTQADKQRLQERPSS